MQSRLYHIPKLHSAQSGFIKKVSWLELYYDLVFVAAYVQLGNQLSKDVSVSGFLGFAAIFMVMWLIWTGFAFYCNRFVVDDPPYDSEKISDQFLALMATLTGHDSTYGETIYAGHAYYPDDLKPNSRFVDIIETLPDGRASIDYAKFHRTEKVASRHKRIFLEYFNR